MNTWLNKTKIFAFFILFFANFAYAGAQDSLYKIRAGTKIRLRMDTEINSKVSSVNDTFTATIAEPVVIRDQIILPPGTVVEGRVTKVSRAAGGGRAGKMEVRFETMRFGDGIKRDMEAFLTEDLTAEKKTAKSVLPIAAGAGIGALIGAVSKSGGGALIGSGIGAGAGAAIFFLKKGANVRIRTGEEFEIELKKELNLPVRDY